MNTFSRRTPTVDQLLAKPLASSYLIYGNEPLLTIEASDKIRQAAYKQGFKERMVFIAESNFQWDSLLEATGNLSLFSEARLLDLRIPASNPGKNGADFLQKYITQPPDETINLISLGEVDWQTKKTVWFKTLEKHTVSLELNAPTNAQLPNWIQERLHQNQQNMSQNALNFFIDQTEGNLLAAHQEIQKLALMFPAGTLSLEQVKSCILDVSRYKLEDLRMAILNLDLARCLKLLEGLQAEGTAHLLVLWAISKEIRTLLSLYIHINQLNTSPSVAFKTLRIFDTASQRLLLSALKKTSPRQLSHCLMHAAKIDRIIKGIRKGNCWHEFATLLMRLCQTRH